MGNGIGRVKKKRQPKYPYQSPNNTFVLPPCSSLSSQRDITNYCCVTLVAHKQHLPVSNLTTTNQVDTDRNNDDDTQSLKKSIKHNSSTPEIPDTTTKNTLVQPNVNSLLCQMSS